LADVSRTYGARIILKGRQPVVLAEAVFVSGGIGGWRRCGDACSIDIKKRPALLSAGR